MADPLELPHISGLVPWQVEDAINKLRLSIEGAHTRLDDAHARLDGLPVPLTLPEIQEALSPSGDYPLPTAGLLNTTPPASTPGDSGGGGGPITPVDDGLDVPPLPDTFLGIVQAAATARSISGASSDDAVFNFMRQVVADIQATGIVPVGLTCGFTDAPALGSNVYTCLGETYRYARVSFSNDHTFKILIDADPGGARTPEWADEGIITGLYRAATPPDAPC